MIILKNGYVAVVLEGKDGQKRARYRAPGEMINPLRERIVEIKIFDRPSEAITNVNDYMKKYDL